MSDSTDFPAAWRFKSDDGDADGPVFLGRFTGVLETAPSSYGDVPVARFIHADSGQEYSIWIFNKSLQDQLSKLRPEVDELVKIEYLGKKISKSSKFSYQSFRASAPERPVVPLTWDSLGAVEEEEDYDE